MTGKHGRRMYKVKKVGNNFQVVIKDSDRQVPGTPSYETRKDAQDHVNQLNENKA